MLAERFFPDTFRASIASVRSYPKNLQQIADEVGDKAPVYNVAPELLFDEVLSVANPKSVDVSLLELKSRGNILKRDIYNYYVAFSDQHYARFPSRFTADERPGDLVNAIEKESLETARPLTVGRQLEIAMDLSGGELGNAVKILAQATRQMARGMDSRITPNLQVSEPRMLNWKKCVAPFGYQSEGNDSAGDTYHFWHGVLAGLSVAEAIDKGGMESIKGKTLNKIYENTAPITDFLRHRLFRKKGKPHGTIDILGLEIGKGLYETHCGKGQET
jgi:hypothetical protein